MNNIPLILFWLGGASQNKTMMQLCCDIFGIPVYQCNPSPNSAALGAAYRGIAAYLKQPFDLCLPPPELSPLLASPFLENKEFWDKQIKQQAVLESLVSG